MPADHPRSRGEYCWPRNCHWKPTGSSPLSRGIPDDGTLDKGIRRIIPALAGNTSYNTPGCFDLKDHPRSRGEYSTRAVAAARTDGSSPLSRGILRTKYSTRRPLRIIPALAGNTLVDKGFYQPDLSDLGNPLLARLRFSKSLAPRLRRPPSWRGGSSGSASEGPGRTIRVSPS